MAYYDIIEASGKGYRFVWIERGYLLRLAFVPFFIKLICHTLTVVLGWEQNLIRQTILMVPSLLADGWMLAHMARLIFLGQRWPFRPGPDAEMDREILHERALGISRGAVIYALTQFLVAGLGALFYTYLSPYANNPEEPPPPLIALLFMMVLFFGVWGFRLIWLYIPASLNYPMRAFVHDIRGYSTSFSMIATWLISMLPPIMMFLLLMSVALSPFQQGMALPSSVNFLLDTLHVGLETVIWLIGTASISYGMIQLIGRGPAPQK